MRRLFFPAFTIAFCGFSLLAKANQCSSALADTLRVTAVQYAFGEPTSFEKLKSRVEEKVKKAAERSDLVVFPELITSELVDLRNTTKSEAQQQADIASHVTVPYFEFIKELASKHKIAILGGTSPRHLDGEIVNTAILALPDGRFFLQDKLFMTPDEARWGWKGSEELKVIDAPWGKTVITTCYDCEFPRISQALAGVAPELILIPSMTGSKSGRNRVGWSARARAVEHYAYVVMTGVAPTAATKGEYYSRAAIITPQEPQFPTEPVVARDDQDTTIFAILSFKKLRQSRERAGYYPARDQERRGGEIRVQ